MSSPKEKVKFCSTSFPIANLLGSEVVRRFIRALDRLRFLLNLGRRRSIAVEVGRARKRIEFAAIAGGC